MLNWVVPTIHPAFVLRGNARYAGVLLHDIKRAIALAHGKVTRWEWDKKAILAPSADAVEEVLGSMEGKRVAYDVETDGRHPIICDLRCAAFFDGTRGITVPFLYRDGERQTVIVKDRRTKKLKEVSRAVWKPYFKGKALAKVQKAIERLAKGKVKRGPSTIFYTQNGQYDRTVLKYRGGFEFPFAHPPNLDTILAHHILVPYLPHGLGFLASLYTDAPFYKSTDDGDSWAAESDAELWLYNYRDVVVTWLAAEKMAEELKERPKKKDLILYAHDAWQEEQAQKWSETGILLDREALAFFRLHYTTVRDRAMGKMRDLLREQLRGGTLAQEDEEAFNQLLGFLDPEEELDQDEMAAAFNPASLRQLRALLRMLGIPLHERTPTGDLSTKAEFLTSARKELLEQGVAATDPRIAFLDYLFAWRESAKVIGTYLFPVVLPDGRVHPTFKVYVVPTGRLASADPNFQNQPAEIRGMFIADDGHVLVMGDWDALEMREGAFLSDDPNFIRVFNEYDAGTGPKPHIVNASTIFGLPATKDLPDKYPGCYRAAKVFAYAVAYGAGEMTVYEKVREEMPDMDFTTFKKCYEAYKAFYAKLFAFQADVVADGTKNRFIETRVLGRRGWFLERSFGDMSHPEASAMQNFPYQGTGADIVSLANKRITTQVVEPWQKKLKKGERLAQLAQVHDELLFVVPQRMTDEFKAEFKRIGEQPPAEGFEHWRLPIDVKAKRRWKPVQTRCRGEKKKPDAPPTPCREFIDVEPVERTPEHVVWSGTCKECGAQPRIEVPRSLEEV